MLLGLFLVNLALCAVLAWRRRTSLLFLAANQAVTLRALSNMAAYGRPAGATFLPDALFAGSRIETAGLTLLLSTGLLATAALAPAKVPRAKPLPALPAALLWGSALLIVAQALATKTILSAEYASSDQLVFSFAPGGATALAYSLVLYELYRRVVQGHFGRWKAFAILFAILLANDYMKGSTGFATGYLICGALVFLVEEHLRFRNAVVLAVLFPSVFIGASAVRFVRDRISSEGPAALGDFGSSFLQNERQTARTGEGLENSANGTQYACHLLECIALEEAGISREWRSIYNPLIYTFEPSFLLGPLGLSRPIDAPEELREHYIHGGGIFLVGDLYWNGGYPCIAIVLVLLLLWWWLCDTRFRSSFFWATCYFQMSPMLLQGIGYGMAQVMRGTITGFLVWGSCVLYWKAAARLQPRPPFARVPLGPTAWMLPRPNAVPGPSSPLETLPSPAAAARETPRS